MTQRVEVRAYHRPTPPKPRRGVSTLTFMLMLLAPAVLAAAALRPRAAAHGGGRRG